MCHLFIYFPDLFHVTVHSLLQLSSYVRYVGLPSPDRFYSKQAGQKIFLMFIPEKKFFSHNYK